MDPSGSLTYEPFFGLREKPFSLSADPRFLFRSPSHGEAFDTLLAGIRRREGLVALTGEIGTGKTILCRSVLQALDRRTFASLIPDPFVSREDLLRTLLVDFGVVSIADLKRGRMKGASRQALSYPLYEFLDSLAPLHAFAVVVIDEAQHLPPPLLDEIRILSELERRDKLLQVVLVGQPELRANLRRPELRQVEQRLSVRCELGPLDRADVAGLIAHRLAIASGGESRVEFAPASLDVVHGGSAGVPRLVNRICDRALERAFRAQTWRIEPEIVWEAIDELGIGVTRPSPPAVAARPPSVISAVQTATRATVASSPRPASAGHDEVRLKPDTTAVRLKPDTTKGKVVRQAGRAGPAAAPVRPVVRRSSAAAVAAVLLVAAAAIAGTLWSARLGSADPGAATGMLPPSPPPALAAPILVAAGPDERGLATAQRAMARMQRSEGVPTGAVVGQYTIQVAVLKTRDLAERVVAELATAGYRARAIDVDGRASGNRLVHVVVSGYSSAIEVERDLRRIRELPGYGGARIVER